MIDLFPYKDGKTVAKLKIELKAYPDLDYSLVMIQNFIWNGDHIETDFREYVCAWAPCYKNGNIEHWGQGHYFTDIEGAMRYMDDMKERNRIMKERSQNDEE